MNPAVLNYLQSQQPNQMQGNNEPQGQAPYNPFDNGIRSAIESAKQSLGMTEKQQDKALRRSMLTFADNIAQQPRQKGLLNNFGSIARSMSPAIAAHDQAEDEALTQNNSMANQILHYKNIEEAKQTNAEEQAWRRQHAESQLGEQRRYHDMMNSYQQQKLQKNNNQDLAQLGGFTFRKMDKVGLRKAEDKDTRLSNTKLAFDNTKKTWDQLQEGAKNNYFRPVGGAFSNVVNKAKDLIGILGVENYQDETALRNSFAAQLGNFNTMLETAKIEKGLTQGMYDRLKDNFPDVKNDSLASIKKKMEYLTHEVDLYAEAAALSVKYGIKVNPADVEKIKSTEEGTKESNSSDSTNSQGQVLMRDPETGEQEAVAADRVQEALSDGLVIVE
jgi:hypothetical protein